MHQTHSNESVEKILDGEPSLKKNQLIKIELVQQAIKKLCCFEISELGIH
jgi:hypothetical protein